MKKSKCKNPQCKKEFIKKNPLVPYCSQRCYNEANQKDSLKVCGRSGCENEFRPLLTTQKYCSNNCHRIDGKQAPKSKTYKINKQSKKHSKVLSKYSTIRKEFLSKPENKYCRVNRSVATQVHHMMGKIGYADDWARDNDIPLWLDVRWFLPVSHEGHREIEENPEWAKEKGFSLDRLKKN
jgi:endogenous inhibitor of DNA gyrase (YacG/DUF329 family)